MSLTKIAYSGAKWTAISSGIITGVQILQTLFLARLLSPADFGLIAIVLMVLNLLQIYSDMGISSAIVHRQDTNEDQLSSLFWLNIVAGLVAFLVTIGLSPLVVLVYNEPQLGHLIFCVALTFLVSPLGTQFGLLLQKELNFRTLAVCEIVAALFGASVMVIAAFKGFGAISFVFGKLAGAGLTAGVFGVIGWRRWRPRFHFARSDLKGYLSFGLYQMGQSTLVFLTGQIDQLFVGIVLGPVALGYYTFALNLVLQPMMKLNYVLTRVAFPLFAKVQFDGERLQRGYLILLWLLVSINAPILVGCAATAPLVVPIIFGTKWLPAVAIVQILALACLFISMMNPVDSLLLAKGRTGLGFVWRFLLLFPELLGVYAGGRLGGLLGVAVAKLILNMVYWAAQYQCVTRVLIGPCLKSYLGSTLPSLGIAGLMGAAIWWWPESSDETPLFSLGSRVVVGATIYVILVLLLQRSRIYKMKELLLAK